MTVSTTVDSGTATVDTLYFAYDASGSPMAVTYNGATYYYVTNLQGDVIALLNSSGTKIASYSYDAWGNPLTEPTPNSYAIEELNPLRYRGYVYDTDTQLYYLQSRYYDPELGRFINADAFASTGQGFLGFNIFAYCLNNPVMCSDPSGALTRGQIHNMVLSRIIDDQVAIGRTALRMTNTCLLIIRRGVFEWMVDIWIQD